MSDSELTIIDEQCLICLVQFERQEVAISQVCRHKFCATCLRTWIREIHFHTCPYCRSEFKCIIYYRYINGAYRKYTFGIVAQYRVHVVDDNNIIVQLPAADNEFQAEEQTVRFLLAYEMLRFSEYDDVTIANMWDMWINNMIPIDLPVNIDENMLIRLRNVIYSRIQVLLHKYESVPNTQMDEAEWLRNFVYPHIEEQLAVQGAHLAINFKLPTVLYTEFARRRAHSRSTSGLT